MTPAPPDLVLFFGRLHPLLVHLPIGLIVLLAAIEIAGRFPRWKHLRSSSGFVLGLAAAGSVFTALFGWLLSLGGGYEERLLSRHLYTGIATAFACCLAGALYWLDLKKAYRATLGLTVTALVVASHFGGSLTHGSDYLVRYAPQPLRAWLGGSPPAEPPAAASAHAPGSRPAPVVFASVIQPMLEKNCVACHGPEKSKGGLRVDSLEALLKGGDSGPGIVPGHPDQGEVIARLRLPASHDDHMPPEGKPQPSADELALLEWWVQTGAAADKTILDLPQPPAIARILQERFPAPGSAPPAPAGPQPKPLAEALALADSLADELNLVISPLSESEPWFQCNAAVVGKEFGDEQLAKLAPLGPNLRWLDLAGTSVSAAGLARLAAMPHLTRLHLERTGIDDPALAALAPLRELVYLNLYGTAVTDSGLKHLEGLPALRQLYLWQSKVTPEAAKKFAESRIDRGQIKEWEAEIERLKTQIRNQRFAVELGAAPAQSGTNAPAESTEVASRPANSKCPVSGKDIDPAHTLAHEGKLVGFCCPNCKAKFAADPKPFLEKLGAEEPPAPQAP